MKMQELRSKTPDELNDLLKKLKKEAFNLRFQKTTGELENTSRVKQVRREVAQINTILSGGDNPDKVKAKPLTKGKNVAKSKAKSKTASPSKGKVKKAAGK